MNSPGAQRPATRSFNVFFDLRLNKPLSKQSWGWWFEMPSRSLWRHCNDHQRLEPSSKLCDDDVIIFRFYTASMLLQRDVRGAIRPSHFLRWVDNSRAFDVSRQASLSWIRYHKWLLIRLLPRKSASWPIKWFSNLIWKGQVEGAASTMRSEENHQHFAGDIVRYVFFNRNMFAYHFHCSLFPRALFRSQH